MKLRVRIRRKADNTAWWQVQTSYFGILWTTKDNAYGERDAYNYAAELLNPIIKEIKRK